MPPVPSNRPCMWCQPRRIGAVCVTSLPRQPAPRFHELGCLGCVFQYKRRPSRSTRTRTERKHQHSTGRSTNKLWSQRSSLWEWSSYPPRLSWSWYKILSDGGSQEQRPEAGRASGGGPRTSSRHLSPSTEVRSLTPPSQRSDRRRRLAMPKRCRHAFLVKSLLPSLISLLRCASWETT